MPSTLNIRIDDTLKKRGETVLKNHGVTVTEAVRMLWKELAESRQLPDFMERARNEKDAKEKKIAALHALNSFPKVAASTLSDHELHELLYDDMLRKYEELS